MDLTIFDLVEQEMMKEPDEAAKASAKEMVDFVWRSLLILCVHCANERTPQAKTPEIKARAIAMMNDIAKTWPDQVRSLDHIKEKQIAFKNQECPVYLQMRSLHHR